MIDTGEPNVRRRIPRLLACVAFAYMIGTASLLTGTLGWWPDTTLGWILFLVAGPPVYVIAEGLIGIILKKLGADRGTVLTRRAGGPLALALWLAGIVALVLVGLVVVLHYVDG